MTVLIQIHYVSADSSLYRKGSYPLKGKAKEQVAWEFWKWIKREHPYECKIEKVLCDRKDITELVIEIEKASLEL